MEDDIAFEYMPRLIDSLLMRKLEEMPAVLVRGPKWCGKTSSCEEIAASALKLRNPDVYTRSVDAAAVRPSLLLKGEQPRLLDEWQLLPIIWDAVTNAADETHGRPGQFLLTGSATPVAVDATMHTGTGRIARLEMSPMSLEESKETTGEVSLAGLFEGAKSVEGVSATTIEDYADLICRGGWPAPISQGRLRADVAAEYLDAVCESDLAEASDRRIDSGRARALIRSISRVSAQEAALTTILADVHESGIGMSEPLLRIYLNALRRIFLLKEVKAWAPTLRSKTPLRSSSVWHLCDPSLAAAALEADANALLDDLTTMGFLFESLCVRDLRTYLQLLNGGIFHYRDKSGLEVDAIARLESGAWAGIEVKLGGATRIEEGAKNLLALAEKVNEKATGSPAFLMVLTGGKYAYTRKDGIHVVPLACLKS